MTATLSYEVMRVWNYLLNCITTSTFIDFFQWKLETCSLISSFDIQKVKISDIKHMSLINIHNFAMITCIEYGNNYGLDKDLTLWLWSFFPLPFSGTKIIFKNPHRARTFFFNVYCLAWTFFFGTHVSRAGNWSSLSPNPRYSVYTRFLKQRTSRFIFRSYVLNVVKIKISFCVSKVGSPRTYLFTFRAT